MPKTVKPTVPKGNIMPDKRLAPKPTVPVSRTQINDELRKAREARAELDKRKQESQEHQLRVSRFTKASKRKLNVKGDDGSKINGLFVRMSEHDVELMLGLLGV